MHAKESEIEADEEKPEMNLA
jgi:hypothetical protein